MLELKKDEQIILSVHKHWIVLFGKFLIIAVMVITPTIGLFFTSYIQQDLALLIIFLISVYFLFIFAIAFMFWVDYYLDMWIITNKRVIDIEQYGLFRREVSEFILNKVQDTTIEIPGIMASILKYGNIIVQTAGEKNFTIKNIANVDKVKDLIIHYSHLTS